ncbi:RTA1 like protein-domain-containing protein [Cadophora sp. MPI-SDFR-AT-0126]|nr:RTA1 like protein-domain-containing protein [Leotiomycetes sp. MPI-SDFR-AT-0126]
MNSSHIPNTGDGPFGPVVNGTQIVFFEYRPNKAAGYSFVVIFGLLSLAHLIYIFWKRAWFFIPFFLGGIAETFGYYGRALASDKPEVVGPFILQNLLILTATPFLAASVYMSFGRIITALDAQRHSILNVRWMTKIYVLIDFACIVSQFIGAVIPASGDPSALKKSKIILLGGLITQVVALSLFIFTCWHAHVRIKQDPPEILLKGAISKWRIHFVALELVTILMIVRSLVRTIEYLQGNDGYIITHEFFLYAFDAALMAIVMGIFLIIYPGQLVRNARRLKSEQDGNFLLRSTER